MSPSHRTVCYATETSDENSEKRKRNVWHIFKQKEIIFELEAASMTDRIYRQAFTE